ELNRNGQRYDENQVERKYAGQVKTNRRSVNRVINRIGQGWKAIDSRDRCRETEVADCIHKYHDRTCSDCRHKQGKTYGPPGAEPGCACEPGGMRQRVCIPFECRLHGEIGEWEFA